MQKRSFLVYSVVSSSETNPLIILSTEFFVLRKIGDTMIMIFLRILLNVNLMRRLYHMITNASKMVSLNALKGNATILISMNTVICVVIDTIMHIFVLLHKVVAT